MDSEKHRSALYENRVCGVRIAREVSLEMLFEKFARSLRALFEKTKVRSKAGCVRVRHRSDGERPEPRNQSLTFLRRRVSAG